MFIEFQADNLQAVYINPERVDAVMSAGRCVEIYVGGADMPFTVRADLVAVIKSLRAALKK